MIRQQRRITKPPHAGICHAAPLVPLLPSILLTQHYSDTTTPLVPYRLRNTSHIHTAFYSKSTKRYTQTRSKQEYTHSFIYNVYTHLRMCADSPVRPSPSSPSPPNLISNLSFGTSTPTTMHILYPTRSPPRSRRSLPDACS